MPQSRNRRVSPAQRPKGGVALELTGCGREYGCRPGHVHADALAGRTAGQERRRRISATSDDGNARLKSAAPGRVGSQLTDNLMGIDDPRQLSRRNVELAAERFVPPALQAVRETTEMQVALIDEGLSRVHAAQPHRHVPAGLHKRGDLIVDLRMLVLPPQDLGTMIETGRPARLLDDLVTGSLLHPSDVGRTSSIQPRVITSDVASVGSDAQDARHLAVDPQASYPCRIDGAFCQALLDAPTHGLELIFRVFLHDAWRRLVESRFAKSRTHSAPLAVEQHGLRALRADVDAQQIRSFHQGLLDQRVFLSSVPQVYPSKTIGRRSTIERFPALTTATAAFPSRPPARTGRSSTMHRMKSSSSAR
jgi:hypothetical protein